MLGICVDGGDFWKSAIVNGVVGVIVLVLVVIKYLVKNECVILVVDMS